MNLLIGINKLLAVACALTYCSAAFISAVGRPQQSQLPMKSSQVRILHPFTQSLDAYTAIGEGALLALHHEPVTPGLPDLRAELFLLGIDERPDADRFSPLIHIGLRDSHEIHGVPVGQKRYLLFERAQGIYQLSPNNQPTHLWFTLRQKQGGIGVDIGMTDREGHLIDEPKERTSFELALSAHRPSYESWQLGPHRVDNSLLARLQARWYGEDQFLTDHGGEGFRWTRGRQRLDFGQGEESYSCFLGSGESLVWKMGRWHNLGADEPSRGLPLLHLKTLKEKIMLFELWDEMGRSRITLTLMKGKDTWMPKHFKECLRFVGARTWSEYVLAAGEERLTVSPQEWLLLNEGRWQVLRQVEEIDAYVNGQRQGELLVLEGLTREGGVQKLVGHLYNTSRTSLEQLEISLTPPLNPQSDTSLLARTQLTRERSAVTSAPPTPQFFEGSEEFLSLPTVVRGLAQQIQGSHP